MSDGADGGAEEKPGGNDAQEVRSVAKGCGLGCLGFLVLSVVVIAIAWMGSGDDEPDPVAPPDANQARFVCEEWVKEQLKAPATAQFTDGGTTGEPVTGFTITGSVDAENGFGALIRNDWTCEVRYVAETDEWRGSASLS